MHSYINYTILFLIFNYCTNLYCQDTIYNYKELEKSLEDINNLSHNDFLALVDPFLNDEDHYLLGLDYLGRYYLEKEVPDSTIYYGNKIYESAINKSDSTSYNMLSKAYNMLAIGYGFKGLTGIRGEYHLKGLDLYEKNLVGVPTSVHHIRGLADYYLDEGSYYKAIPLYKKSIEIDKNKYTSYFAYNNLGQVYMRLKLYKTALNYLEKACEAPIGHKARGYCIESTSACYLNMGKPDKAIEYGLLAQEMFSDKNLKFILFSNNTIGKAYHQKKMYAKAISIFKDILEKVQPKGYIDIEIEVLENLSKSLFAQKKNVEANRHIIQMYKLKDSLVQIQKDKQNQELEIKYQILEKEKQIELLKKDQEFRKAELISEKNIKKLMIIAFLIILVPSVTLLIVYNQKLQTKNKLSKKQKEINEEKINSIIKEQELKLMKTSLEIQHTERKRIAQDLHDSIGGNLAAIKLQFDSSNKGGKKNLEKVKRQIDETYNLIREISHNLMPQKFYQKKFIRLVKEYVYDIGSIHNLEIIFNFSPEEQLNKIDDTISMEIFRIIQELLTNTLKHAQATKIDIQIDLLNDLIYLIFEDNGIGFEVDNINSGLGLDSIKNRLKKIDGTFRVDSSPNKGAIIKIKLKASYHSIEIPFEHS